MATATGLAAAALFGLLALLAVVREQPGRSPSPAPDSRADHPESLTATLDPVWEEYLACLADRLWPADEYLELETEWRHELAWDDGPDPDAVPECSHCGLRREDVWPCPECGRMLHPSCGNGVSRRTPARPYWMSGADPEAVVGEWVCTGCEAVVGLDVDNGDEADDDLLR